MQTRSGKRKQDNLLDNAPGIKHLRVTPSPHEDDTEPHHEADKGQAHATASQIEDFRPRLRSGVLSAQGERPNMQDRHVVIHDLGLYEVYDAHSKQEKSVPLSYYAVMDGHFGEHAAEFAKNHLHLNFVETLLRCKVIEVALMVAFIKTDHQFKDAWLKDKSLASGTTALVAVIAGNMLYVANAGDCRAVLCRNGTALDMSVDHDPRKNKDEYKRIDKAGGYLEAGYLNGIVNMSRALGNWDHEGLKEPNGPLTSMPEIKEECLTEDDEFLIVASDGLFKRTSSQHAVNVARKELQTHNDLDRCARNLPRDI